MSSNNKKAALDKKAVRGRSIFWKKLESRVFETLEQEVQMEASFELPESSKNSSLSPLLNKKADLYWKETIVGQSLLIYFDQTIPFPLRLRQIALWADSLNEALGTNYPDYKLGIVLESYGTGLYPELEKIKWYNMQSDFTIIEGASCAIYSN